MGELQRFEADRVATESGSMSHLDMMTGLVTGISVRPRPGEETVDPPPERSIHLWTGKKEGVFGDRPELGFVVQDGSAPPPDSTRVPGSPLVLTRGEPTEIIVHNRLDFPLPVHWHGLELRSRYDGGATGADHPRCRARRARRVALSR